MKRKRGTCTSEEGTYEEVWKQLAELLRIPSLRSNMQVLVYLEQNFDGLVIRSGSDNALTLRGIFSGCRMAQARACSRWRHHQFPGVSKADVLKKMKVLRLQLLHFLHESQRRLSAKKPMSSETLAACKPMSSQSVNPEVSAEVSSVNADVPRISTEVPSVICEVPSISATHVFEAAFLMPYQDVRAGKAPARSGSPPRHWILGGSPMFRGHANVTIKRMALNVMAKVKKWLRDEKGSQQLAPIKWNPEYFNQAKKYGWSKIRRRAALARCKVKNRWGHLVADMCGVGYTSFTRWSREYQATGLRSPVNPGPPSYSQEVYQDMFKDLLMWGEAICKSRRDEGKSTRMADLADIALESEAFRESVNAALVSRESIVTHESERLLDMLRFTDGGQDEKETEERRNHVLRRLKSLLQRLGFEWKQIVRECIKTVTNSDQIHWALRFGRWYFKFLTEPRTDCFLYWMDESFIYEGEGVPGSMVEPAAAQGKHVVFPELGNFRRIGLLDGLVLFWQQLSKDLPRSREDEELLEKAARDPNNWFVAKQKDDYYVLRCSRLPIGSLVWPSQKSGEDGKAERKSEPVPKRAETDRGNMNGERFQQWLARILEQFAVVRSSESLAALQAKLSELEPSLDSPDKFGALLALLGRQAVFIMDGASYHKVTNPDYVARKGKGSLFGEGGKGKEDEKVGWKKERCIKWICNILESGPGIKFEDAKAKLDPAHFEYVTQLETLKVIDLRYQIDADAEHERYVVKRMAIDTGAKVMFTPPYIGKFWNPVELLWSSTKRAYRGLPEAARKNELQAIAAIQKILKGFENRDQSLINMCLPGFRFSFAVLSALYHQNLVEYKGQRVLFPALEQSILDEARNLRRRIEFAVSVDGLCETAALEWDDEDNDLCLAPKGMSTHKFPATILHRDRSLRQFRLIQVEDRNVVEVPDVAAAPPPLAHLESVAALADDEADTPTAADVSKGDSQNLAVTRRSRINLRATRKQPPPKPKVMPTSEYQRLAGIREALRKSHIRCTCGMRIHQERCCLWTNTHPRKLQTPGADVGLSEEDYQFYQRHRRPLRSTSCGLLPWGHR